MSYVQKYCLGILLLLVIYLGACINKTEQKTNSLHKYKIKVTPDSVAFGKNREVILSIKNLKAVDVKNLPENDTSIEITYNLEVTNKSSINNESVFVDPRQFRLVLNNQKKITHAFYNALGADPQSTTISTGNIFNLPAGTKPVALDLFFADSIARITITLN